MKKANPQWLNKILIGDNRKLLSKIPDNSINLTITSPPYRNAIDYKMHVKHGHDSGENYRGKLSVTIPAYVRDMAETFEEVKRITTDGGYCCIIIGNEINNGTLEALPSLLLTKLLKQGWQLHEEIMDSDLLCY